MPLEKDGIDDVQEKLSGKMLVEELRSIYFHGNWGLEDVLVEIPQFQIKRSVEMKDQMTELGMEDLFTEKSDLSAMSVKDRLFAAEMWQKCYFVVGENGTEAASATGNFSIS